MSAPTMRTTLLLTEHLGYPPISLVDDIINAVNELMYKCTQAMEKYLLERNFIGGRDYTGEIQVGIAKLETLWEHSVDRSFDKLELYILRNVLQIPQELMENGSFRLRHHESLVLPRGLNAEDQLLEGVAAKMQELRVQLLRHAALRGQLQKCQKLLFRIQSYKKLVLTAFNDGKAALNEEQRAIWRSLAPVNESVKFLSSQVRELLLESSDQCSSDRVHSLITHQETSKTGLYSRTRYLAQNTRLELQELTGDATELASHSDHELGTDQSLPESFSLVDPDWSALRNASAPNTHPHTSPEHTHTPHGT
ncbi:LAME_0B01530g1_1 [Lachancea meyersii CBS 8951]|uniref:LAME_0B01530g1_1 n=1 Tax=Lachancea meyersii CBS 8951 TaxID=1266667 RepID=A0A1G4ITR7_9SACH|nr:LAME_0B01530g1_1 [Lachancea meyersii CBS 8951]